MENTNSAPSKKIIRVVGAAILKDDGMLLCAQRGPGRELEGFWEFPGGKIEPGEAPRQALVREIHEELHCTIAVGDHLATTIQDYPFGTIELATFLCRLASGQPEITEHEQLCWHHIDHLPRLNQWAPADREAVVSLKEKMQ